MHPNSMCLMHSFKDKHIDRIRGKIVLDVGSQNLNGSYRELFESLGCEYAGTDIVPGDNVDVVSSEDRLNFGDETFDVVVCGQVFEHVKNPFLLASEISRVLKSGGIVCWIAPWRWQIHKDGFCPFDRWRILEDGMRTLAEHAELTVLDCAISEDDTFLIAEKEKWLTEKF